MSPTVVVTTREGAQYEFTADRLHVRQDGSWKALDIAPNIERGFRILQVFRDGGFGVTGNVASIQTV